VGFEDLSVQAFEVGWRQRCDHLRGQVVTVG
jgi:hypothetical protein